MNKLLLTLLVIISVYLIFSLYFLDKVSFLCPIEYNNGIVIRCDSRGDGSFAASRNGNRIHQGSDLFAKIGTPVFACLYGRASVLKQANGMGNYVIIRHPGNLTTLYGHLLKIYVKDNTFIRQGQLIGAVGKTGNANSPAIQPHLHFEMRKNGVAQDPLEYLE